MTRCVVASKVCVLVGLITVGSSGSGVAEAAPRPALSARKAQGPLARGPFMARLVARGFFRALVAGDVETMLPMCAREVDLDGRRVRRGHGLREALGALARRAVRKQIKLRWIRLLDSRQMRARFGVPPARIAPSIRGPQHFALARFNHLGAVAVLAKVGRFYRVVALTD